MTVPSQILPGDLLLYNTPGSFVDWCIRIKTWSIAAHCECYIGGGASVASRNWSPVIPSGVGKYPFRHEGLVAILRPSKPFDLEASMRWFYAKANGEGYDLKGLLCFSLAVAQGSPDKMFCSEFLTRFYRMGGFNCFHTDWDADRVAPGSFLMVPDFDKIILQPVRQPIILGHKMR